MSTAKKRIDISVRTKKEFFKRGKEIARKADKGETLEPVTSIWFEDPKDLAKFLSEAKLELIKAIRKRPMSIPDLVVALQRHRASLTRDINILEQAGLVKSEMVVNPGHGRVRVVRASSKEAVTLMLKF